MINLGAIAATFFTCFLKALIAHRTKIEYAKGYGLL